MNAVIDRRGFLKGSGALIVSFALSMIFGRAAATATNVMKPVDLNTVESFLAIGSDGEVTVYSGKVDLGTAATARRALLQEAGKRFNVVSDSLRIADGIVNGPNERHVPLQALIGSHGLSGLKNADHNDMSAR